MKPTRQMSTTRALALPAPASLHPMVLWALMLATLLLMSIPRLRSSSAAYSASSASISGRTRSAASASTQRMP